MLLNKKIKTLIIALTTVSSSWALAQAQPQANGHALGSTTTNRTTSVSATQSNTNSTATGTTGGMGTDQDVTTMQPMDPSRDSRTTDIDPATGRDRRAGASGTVTPTNPRY